MSGVVQQPLDALPDLSRRRRRCLRAALAGQRRRLRVGAGGVVRGRVGRRFGRQEQLFALYVTLSALSVAAFIAFNVALISHARS